MAATFVTCCYNLNTSRRSIDDYLLLFKQLPLLEIPFLIIYTDLDTLSYIQQSLNDHFEQNDYIDKYQIKLIELEEMTKKVPKLLEEKKDYDNPDYKFLINYKVDFLKNSVLLNPFKTTKFAWIDFGICHICKPTPQDMKNIIDNMGDKIKFPLIYIFHPAFLTDKKGMYKDYRSYLGGGLISGSGDAILELYELYQKELHEMYDLGVYGYDETVMLILKETYPEKFDTYYTSYTRILKNIPYMTGDAKLTIRNIEFANEQRLYDRGVELIHAFLDSMVGNHYMMVSSAKLIRFLFHSHICAHYSSDQELASNLASLIQAIYDHKPNQRHVFYGNWHENISFTKYKKYTREEFYNSPYINICGSIM